MRLWNLVDRRAGHSLSQLAPCVLVSRGLFLKIILLRTYKVKIPEEFFTPMGGFDSILNNAEVSFYKNIATLKPIKTVKLIDFLRNTAFEDEVLRLRGTKDETKISQQKLRLPAITPAGVFICRTEVDFGNNFVKGSGFLAFDLDHKLNRGIVNFHDLKEQISHLPFVAYCGLSVSGHGFWGLVPIAPYQSDIRREFMQNCNALFEIFASYHIYLDAGCHRITHTRTISYDPEAYFNHHAKTLQEFYR